MKSGNLGDFNSYEKQHIACHHTALIDMAEIKTFLISLLLRVSTRRYPNSVHFVSLVMPTEDVFNTNVLDNS